MKAEAEDGDEDAEAGAKAEAEDVDEEAEVAVEAEENNADEEVLFALRSILSTLILKFMLFPY